LQPDAWLRLGYGWVTETGSHLSDSTLNVPLVVNVLKGNMFWLVAPEDKLVCPYLVFDTSLVRARKSQLNMWCINIRTTIRVIYVIEGAIDIIS
jgi:hypothetical protein